MPTGHAIDHDSVHAALFSQADRKGRLLLKQGDLAKEIGVTKFTMSRLISRMTETKRIRKIGTRENNVGYFIVEDPEVWQTVYGE